MTELDTTSSRAILELQQLVSDYCFDLDETHGLNSHMFFDEACVVDVGAMTLRGIGEVRAFYEELARIVGSQGANAVRTTRHAWNNLRIAFADDSTATVSFLMTNYSASGSPPVPGATVPTVISDGRFRCRRGADGRWRILEFTGAPIFIGDDPLQNKLLMGEA